MAKFKERIKVRQLRLEGASINDIAQKLGLSKSTVSYWCKDIRLSPQQIEKLVQRQLSASYKGRLKAVEKKRFNRLQEIEQLKWSGRKEIGKLNKREFLMAGLGIYWGEGYKSLTTAAITSSDLKIILFMLKWFKETCQIPAKDLIFRVGLNASHKHRVQVVEKYWSEKTGIPLNQFTKTTLIKTITKKIYSHPDNYYGTLRVCVRRSSRLQRKILGWIEGLTISAV